MTPARKLKTKAKATGWFASHSATGRNKKRLTRKTRELKLTAKQIKERTE